MTIARFRSSVSYDDLPPVPVVGARLGSTAPTLATFVTDIEQFTFDASNDYIIGAVEFTHGYAPGTTFEAHVHWAQNGANGTGSSRYVRFQMKYSILHIGAVAGAQQTINTGELNIPNGSADRTYYLSTLGEISGAGLSIGDYIVFRFERIAAVGTAPAADPFVIAVGFHAIMDSSGSMTRYTK